MGRKVLVLNADYSAISICTVSKAFLLVYLNKAELVAASDKVALRTVSNAYPLPSVIRLNAYVSVPYKSVMLTRHNIFRRDGNCCVYCGDSRDLTLDHVLPKSKGGPTNWNNLVTACKRCNSRKGNATPEEANMPLRHRPYKPTFVMFLKDYAKGAENKWEPFLKSKSGS